MDTNNAEVGALLDHLADAWQTNAGAAVASFFVEDGSLVNPFGERADGREAVAEMYTKYFEGLLRGTTTTFGTPVVRSMGGEYAFVDVVQTILGPDDQVALVVNLSAVLRRNGDQWRFVDARPYVVLAQP